MSRARRVRSSKGSGWSLLVCSAALAWAGAVSAGEGSPSPAHRAARARTVRAADLGIEVVSLRPAAQGRLLDLRVRVLDPDKAAALVGRVASHGIRLVEPRTGRALGIVHSNVGSLQPRTSTASPGRIYGFIFQNPGVAKPGDELVLFVGGKRLPGLFVASPAAPLAKRD